ncbi:MAG: universal stress protein, partial [Thermomicrobiales bacterium]
MYQRIVVPLDGSRFAERALPDAERLARLTGATIHLVRFVDLTRYGQLGASLEYADADQARADEHSAAAAYLQSIAGRIVVSGLVAETEVRFGQPCRELVAATQSGDLLVMASHDLG